MDNNEVVTEEVAAVVENNTGIEIEPLFEEQVDFDTFSKSDFAIPSICFAANTLLRCYIFGQIRF